MGSERCALGASGLGEHWPEAVGAAQRRERAEDFTIYNLNVNLYAVCHLSFEALGGKGGLRAATALVETCGGSARS